jgi:hypothetical protein
LPTLPCLCKPRTCSLLKLTSTTTHPCQTPSSPTNITHPDLQLPSHQKRHTCTRHLRHPLFPSFGPSARGLGLHVGCACRCSVSIPAPAYAYCTGPYLATLSVMTCRLILYNACTQETQMLLCLSAFATCICTTSKHIVKSIVQDSF